MPLKKKINSTKREVIRELNYTSHISAALKPLLNTPHTFLQPQDSPRETRTFHLLSLLSHRKLLDPPIDRPPFSHNLLSKIWHRENEKEREGGILCVKLPKLREPALEINQNWKTGSPSLFFAVIETERNTHNTQMGLYRGTLSEETHLPLTRAPQITVI